MSFSTSITKVFNIIFSDIVTSHEIQLSSSSTPNNIIINILYNLTANYTGTSPLAINLKNVSLNNALLNINVLNNSKFALTVPTLNVQLNASTIISNLPILPHDVISQFFSGNGLGFTGSSVISSIDVFNNLVVNYTGRGTGFTGQGFGTGFTGPSLTNPLMTRGNIQSDLPDLLLPYLDGVDTIGFTGVGPNPSDNKIVTTLNLANDLVPYLAQPQFPLSSLPGGNKLVTSYGNSNLISNFFGSLASNPGFITAVASEIIENDNITSISIINNSTISLVDNLNLSANDIYLFKNIEDYLGYTGGTAYTGTSGPINFTNLTLTLSAAIAFLADPFYSELEPSLLVQGNLLNSVIVPPTSTLSRYALVKGLLPLNSYNPGATGATGAFPVFEFIDPNAIIMVETGYTGFTGATGIYLPDSTGIISFREQSPKIAFPCTAYGLIDNSPSPYAYTIPAATYPPAIINAMLPLYTELAVAAGLAFENEVAELKNEIDQLTNDLGVLGALANYLQAYSENIYVVGLYTSTISINGNGAPIGYSYYNGYGYTGTTGNAPSIWNGSYYTPPPLTLNLNSFSLPPADGTESTNVQTTDFSGTNTCTTIPNQVIYPINNTIIIPFSYKGFGSIGNAPNTCNHPPYVLSINLNNLYYSSGAAPTGYSNGYVIQQGTTIKVCNESNYIVQLTSRNLTYAGSYPTTSSVPSTIIPVPASPFTSFLPITPLPDANPPNSASGYQGVTGPSGWPLTNGYTNPTSAITINSINLRDTTSDVIYIKAGDSIRLVFSQNTNGSNGGTWGYL
jgi:hypothetical protein